MLERARAPISQAGRTSTGLRIVVLLVVSLTTMLLFVVWLAVSFNERITKVSASESDQTIWNIAQVETDFLRMLLAAENYNSTYVNSIDDTVKQQQYSEFVTRFDILYSRVSVFSTTVGQRISSQSYSDDVLALKDKTIAWAAVVDSIAIGDELAWASFMQDLRDEIPFVRGLITTGLEAVVQKEEQQRLEELIEWQNYSQVLTIIVVIILATIIGSVYFAIQLYLKIRSAETTVSVLTDTSRELELLSITDPLTGLLTRRALDHVLKSDAPISATVLWLDIDEFKSVNDTWGHNAGDELLQAVADGLREFGDDTTHIFRLGGEEFGIISPCYDRATAQEWAERIRNRVAQSYIVRDGYKISRTASIGITHKDESMTPKEALQVADRAMYEAKTAGKNRVQFKPSR